MKSFWKDMLISIFIGLILPGFFLNFAVMLLEKDTVFLLETEPQTEAQWEPMTLQMKLHSSDGTVVEQDMDSYLVGVVLAEMPASFEMEALKAQAVVARTYTLKAYTTGGKHGDGSVCTEASCCQAYISEENYLEKGGTQESVDKIRSAVLSTSGYVLTYEGELIEATYFACSGGSTEDALAVWGTDYPYLRSVSSPGEEQASYFTDSKSFSKQQLQGILGVSQQDAHSKWLGMVTYTAGGGVDTIELGNQQYRGMDLRMLLELRSTAFTVEETAEKITFYTRGYGHRVGMSQYGADAMAAAGSSYQEILAYYYQGTSLIEWEDKGNPTLSIIRKNS